MKKRKIDIASLNRRIHQKKLEHSVNRTPKENENARYNASYRREKRENYETCKRANGRYNLKTIPNIYSEKWKEEDSFLNRKEEPTKASIEERETLIVLYIDGLAEIYRAKINPYEKSNILYTLEIKQPHKNKIVRIRAEKRIPETPTLQFRGEEIATDLLIRAAMKNEAVFYEYIEPIE
ncbi:MAG: hypothetical protein J6S67_07055 [Methanobrevibacter sp.]|nr:hypothetical protein [Methanobrevibacter sp.]